MDKPPTAAKLAAHAGHEAREYAETRIAELEHALNHMAHKQETADRQHLSYRLAVHLAGLTIALVATLATLGLAIPVAVKLGLPFLPSVALEVIDKRLRF